MVTKKISKKKPVTKSPATKRSKTRSAKTTEVSRKVSLLDLSVLGPAKGSRKDRHRLGRGNASGSGRTAGRGEKGQRARSGGRVRLGFEGGQMPLYRRIPKFGFVSRKQILGSTRYQVVNLEVLERFENGATVDREALDRIGFGVKSVHRAGLKVLGSGKLTKKLTVHAEAVSQAAQVAIEKVGGSVTLVKSK